MRSFLPALPKWLFSIAALWAVVSGFIIFFFSGATSITVTSESTTQVVRHLNWYESQGWWGVAILFIFAALYYGPLHFYNRGRRGMVVLFGLVAIVLSLLAGFSVGGFYLPGALALLLGQLAMLLQAKPAK